MEVKPDFKKAYILANEMLVAAHCIKTFPFDAKEFVHEQTDIKFCSYKCAREKYGICCQDLGSASSLLVNYEGKNIVFYNQDEYNLRDSFNRMHETGHFMSGHKTDLEESDPLYKIQEIETNFFAAQMLMPLQVIQEIQKRGYKVDVAFLTRNFGVSEAAAKKRIATISKHPYLSIEEKFFDDIIVTKFRKFIDKVAPKKELYSYSCWNDPMQAERDAWY